MKLNKWQDTAISTERAITLVKLGRGAGKSFVAKQKSLCKLVAGNKVGYVDPLFWREGGKDFVKEFGNTYNLTYRHSTKEVKSNSFGGSIRYLGNDKHANRGYSFDVIIVDHAEHLCSPEMLQTLILSLRGVNKTQILILTDDIYNGNSMWRKPIYKRDWKHLGALRFTGEYEYSWDACLVAEWDKNDKGVRYGDSVQVIDYDWVHGGDEAPV
jgi:hypothetical protein